MLDEVWIAIRTDTSLRPGAFREEVPLPDALPLERKETTLSDSEDGELFLQLMQKMLQWDPAKRSSAKALVEDEWIRRYT